MSSTSKPDDRFQLTPDIDTVLELLYDAYGKPAPEPEDDILATLVATILSQSTNNANSDRAFGDLVDRFQGDWQQVQDANVDEVADAIAIGGLSNQKAPRIQAILEKVYEDFGEHSLEDLRTWEVKKAERYLRSMKGVGPKTAAFVLMRAAQMPLFAMDTHILRLARRLGWISPTLSDTKAHEALLPHIPEGDHDPAHVAMIWHGRRTCHARSPACESCALLSLCVHGQKKISATDTDTDE
jgi:endonuclease-3